MAYQHILNSNNIQTTLVPILMEFVESLHRLCSIVVHGSLETLLPSFVQCIFFEKKRGGGGVGGA